MPDPPPMSESRKRKRRRQGADATTHVIDDADTNRPKRLKMQHDLANTLALEDSRTGETAPQENDSKDINTNSLQSVARSRRAAISRRLHWLYAQTSTLICTISLGSLESDKSDADLPISSSEGFDILCSYNWLNEKNPTILVPGGAPIFTAPDLPLKIEADKGLYYVDMNAFKNAQMPFEPMFRALSVVSPAMRLDDVDLVVNRNSLLNLFEFVKGNYRKNFAIRLDLVKNTLFVTRREKQNQYELGSSDANPYWGHAFEEAFSTYGSEMQGSESHHRAIRYRFGGLVFVVRHEVDAAHASTPTSTAGDETTAQADHDHFGPTGPNEPNQKTFYENYFHGDAPSKDKLSLSGDCGSIQLARPGPDDASKQLDDSDSSRLADQDGSIPEAVPKLKSDPTKAASIQPSALHEEVARVDEIYVSANRGSRVIADGNVMISPEHTQHHVSGKPPVVKNRQKGKNTAIKIGGKGTAPSDLIEMKARPRMKAEWARDQQWFGRTPHLAIGMHNKGEFSAVSHTDQEPFFQSWEQENQERLKDLARLISLLRQGVSEVEGKHAIAIFRNTNRSELELWNTTKSDGPLPMELIENHWTKQPET